MSGDTMSACNLRFASRAVTNLFCVKLAQGRAIERNKEVRNPWASTPQKKFLTAIRQFLSIH